MSISLTHYVRSQADADQFVATAKRVNSELPESCRQEEVDEKLMRTFAMMAAGDVCPMQAVIGGITAQEVMKVRHAQSTTCTMYTITSHTTQHLHDYPP